MWPELLPRFTLPVLGEIVFPSYLVLLLVGFTAAVILARRQEDRAGRDGNQIADLGLLMLATGILGARIFSVLFDGKLVDFVHLCTDPMLVDVRPGFVCVTDAQCGDPYLCNTTLKQCYPQKDCFAALKFWQGGLTFYGGFLAAIVTSVWVSRKKRMGILRVADLIAPYTALGLAFGRIGCFLNGCCYGSPTDLPWGVHFPHRSGPVHPTQLYETLGALALFFVLRWGVAPRQQIQGRVFGALLAGYGVFRFLLEFLRDDARGAFLSISTSQWVSLPLIAIGAWLLVRRGAPVARPTGLETDETVSSDEPPSSPASH